MIKDPTAEYQPWDQQPMPYCTLNNLGLLAYKDTSEYEK